MHLLFFQIILIAVLRIMGNIKRFSNNQLGTNRYLLKFKTKITYLKIKFKYFSMY